ncbi:hypothetical protein GCM10027073_56530 [Streptomyces chlorus]
MRIVSLLPAATDIVAELGLSEQLVGRTHECDWPPREVAPVPVVTGSDLNTEMFQRVTPPPPTSLMVQTEKSSNEAHQVPSRVEFRLRAALSSAAVGVGTAVDRGLRVRPATCPPEGTTAAEA